MRFISKRLLFVLSVIILTYIINYTAFYIVGHNFNVLEIWYKLLNPHKIDFVDDIIHYWKGFIVSLSLHLNVLSVVGILWLKSGSTKGFIRWGYVNGNSPE